jgi:hypothetical protein
MAMAKVNDLICMWNRLTFGGASNLPAWRAISELQTDLANDILSNDSWQIPDLADESYISS